MWPELQPRISPSLFKLKKHYNNIHKQSAIVYNKSEKAAINILGWEPKLLGGSENQSGKTKQYFGVL